MVLDLLHSMDFISDVKIAWRGYENENLLRSGMRCNGPRIEAERESYRSSVRNEAENASGWQ